MKSLFVSLVLCSVACGATDIPNNSAAGLHEDNSSCPYNVVRHDPTGWLLTTPEVHFDFWGDWNQYTNNPSVESPSDIYSNWFDLLDQDGVLSRLAEYGIHPGSIGSFSTNTGSTTYASDGGADDAGVQLLEDGLFPSTINNEIQMGWLPYPNDNTLYVIMLPPNVSSVAMTTHNWGAYHTHSTYGSQRYTYAIISYGDGLVYTSHEIYEAATNPDGSGGWWDTASGNEVGDLCEGSVYDSEDIGGFQVQRVWSQALCSCQ